MGRLIDNAVVDDCAEHYCVKCATKHKSGVSITSCFVSLEALAILLWHVAQHAGKPLNHQSSSLFSVVKKLNTKPKLRRLAPNSPDKLG
jgi:hypothetical protein